MTASSMYLQAIKDLVTQMEESQAGSFDAMSSILADCVQEGKLIYVWGPGGHSSVFAEDVAYRKGELAAVIPIIDPGISLSHGVVKEINGLERVVGLGKAIIEYNRIGSGDVIIFGSGYGVNPVLIEAVMECKERGVKVLAVTSPAFSKNTTFAGAMHESQVTLYKLADIYIDSFVPYGDAVVELEGADEKIAPVATIMQLIALKAVMADAMQKLYARGIKPPIWQNSLREGGVEANAEYIKRVWGKAKSM